VSALLPGHIRLPAAACVAPGDTICGRFTWTGQRLCRPVPAYAPLGHARLCPMDIAHPVPQSVRVPGHIRVTMSVAPVKPEGCPDVMHPPTCRGSATQNSGGCTGDQVSYRDDIVGRLRRPWRYMTLAPNGPMRSLRPNSLFARGKSVCHPSMHRIPHHQVRTPGRLGCQTRDVVEHSSAACSLVRPRMRTVICVVGAAATCGTSWLQRLPSGACVQIPTPTVQDWQPRHVRGWQRLLSRQSQKIGAGAKKKAAAADQDASASSDTARNFTCSNIAVSVTGRRSSSPAHRSKLRSVPQHKNHQRLPSSTAMQEQRPPA